MLPAAEHQLSIPDEASTAAVGRPQRPEGQRMQPGRSAHRRPGVREGCPVPITLESEVNEEGSVGRQIASLRVEAPFEPGTAGERVAPGLPEDEMEPLR